MGLLHKHAFREKEKEKEKEEGKRNNKSSFCFLYPSPGGADPDGAHVDGQFGASAVVRDG